MSLADFFVKGLPQAPETVAPSQPSDDQKGKPSTLCYSSHLFYKWLKKVIQLKLIKPLIDTDEFM